MAKAAPKRSDYPKGLIGQAKYDAALKRYKESYGPPSPKPAKPAKPEGKVNRRGRSVPTAVGPKDGETEMKEGNLFRFDAKSKTWKLVNTPNKPAAKPEAKPVGGLARNWRSRASGSPASADAPPAPAPLRSPAFSAPVHSKPQDFGSAYAPQAGQAPRPNAPVASSYRDGGKGLYKGSEEYVKATGGNYNPLMQRTFGYQTGGQPGAAQAPGTPPQSNDKVNTPMSPQYNGNDEPGALGQAENPMAALGQMLLQRKKLSISLSN